MITKYWKRLSPNAWARRWRNNSANGSIANTALSALPGIVAAAHVDPLLSSIVLNWNRADLLKRTLESIAATVTVPHELFVIDNGSTDGSRELIAKFCERRPNTQAILLDENRGGEAINLALQAARGQFIHLSENDIEYLPGWCETIIGLFESFSKLGQLSLFGPTPTDEEVWINQQGVLRHSKGRILYEAAFNIGTTSVFRRELVDHGLRVYNLATNGKFLFPDDVRLSTEIKAAGYFVALAPHYLVQNLGHWATEFQSRPDYYRENYRSKPVGEQSWRERIEHWMSRPRPNRRSFLLPDERVSTEKSTPNAECSEPWLWSMFDGWTAELETIEFLYALVRLTKPNVVLETGTWHGTAATAMGKALRENGRGSLVSIELDDDSHAVAQRRINGANLQDVVALIHGSSLDFVPDRSVDFALFNSDLSLRGREFAYYRQYLAPGAMILFHNTSTSYQVGAESVNKLLADRILEGFLLPTPRGLAVCRYRSSAG